MQVSCQIEDFEVKISVYKRLPSYIRTVDDLEGLILGVAHRKK